MPQVGIILDAIYQNSGKPKFEQMSLEELSKKCGVSRNTLSKIRKILQEKKLLIVEGDRRSQTAYWHPDKCTPNPMMLTEIYKSLVKDAKSRVKVNKVTAKRLPTMESALLLFKKEGYASIKLTKVVGYKTIEETIDLALMEVRE